MTLYFVAGFECRKLGDPIIYTNTTHFTYAFSKASGIDLSHFTTNVYRVGIETFREMGIHTAEQNVRIVFISKIWEEE